MIRKEIETCEDLIALDNALRAWWITLRKRYGDDHPFIVISANRHNKVTYHAREI